MGRIGNIAFSACLLGRVANNAMILKTLQFRTGKYFSQTVRHAGTAIAVECHAQYMHSCFIGSTIFLGSFVWSLQLIQTVSILCSEGSGRCSHGSYGDDLVCSPKFFICERSSETASSAKVGDAVFFVAVVRVLLLPLSRRRDIRQISGFRSRSTGVASNSA